jgi:electron-transferring-flavoprotein dehydrogenase
VAVEPADFPPPVDNADFVGPPTDPEEDRIEVGIAIVGGGPAGLAAAIKAAQLLETKPVLKEQLGEVPIAVIEKGKVAGSHLLSGANMRPSAMRELFPDLPPEDWPVFQEVTKDAVYVLTPKRAIPLKPMPPNFRNHGNYVTSVAQLGRFLSEKAEELGVYVLSETAATKLLVEDRIVKGVRTGDKGRGRDGEPLSNFEPGSDVMARATVLAEGTLGHLTMAALDYYDMHGRDPMRWEIGVKEIWEVPKPLDRVIHTMGWPLRTGAKYREFGGSFIYPMGEDKVCVGFVVGLDYTDATFSCHDVLQRFKTHPFVRKILDGGKRVGWGAKTIPSGGWWSMPEHLSVPGMCIAGDNACMLNVPELKGIHYAMHAGMYAAETIVDSLEQNSINFEAYDEKVRKSAIGEDLYRSRNMRQPFAHGFFVGGVLAGTMTATRGVFPGGHWGFKPDSEEEMFIGDAAAKYPKPDNKYLFDKLSSVFASGNATRDDAPNHVRVQTKVPLELAQAWAAMCPAQVYEIPEDQLEAAQNGNGDGTVEVQITASNCVQCGAINAKGGRLTLPEGGDGPNYTLA